MAYWDICGSELIKLAKLWDIDLDAETLCHILYRIMFQISDSDNLKIVKGDIRDTELLNKALAGHDILIHLACISNDPSFELNPKLGKSINLDAFVPLVETAKKNSIKKWPKAKPCWSYD